MEADRQPYDPAVHGERRRREPLVYSPDQLVGRAPIRLRRASDKRRLAAHILIAVLLVSLSAWWALIPHAFAGPVILSVTAEHGMHIGDLPVLLYGALAGRSLLVAGRVLLTAVR